MKRIEVYKLIDGEREYQDRVFPGHIHGAGAYLTYISRNLTLAIEAAHDADGDEKPLAYVRKIAALAVACMEQNGVVFRDNYYPIVIGGADRAVVYSGIDTERAYQEGGAGHKFPTPRRNHEVSECLTMLRHYLRKADEAWCMNAGNLVALDVVRKLAGICVRCMEIHGAPAR